MTLTNPPELTTAASDLVLACLAGWLSWRLLRDERAGLIKNSVWKWTTGLLAAGAALGGIAHGLDLSTTVRFILWLPLSLFLFLTIGLFATAVVLDWKGTQSIRAVLRFMITLGLAGFATLVVLRTWIPHFFIVFVIYSSVALITSLVICLLSAKESRNPGPLWVALSIALIITGSVIQSLRAIHFTVIWDFDFNTVYHMFVMCSLVPMYVGIRKSRPNEKPASP